MFSLIIAAQEEESAPEPTFGVSGSIDTYYRSSEFAPAHLFANLPGFAMGMANIIMSVLGRKKSVFLLLTLFSVLEVQTRFWFSTDGIFTEVPTW